MVIVFLFLFMCIAVPILSQELDGEAIIQKVSDIINPDSSYGKARMVIITSSGKSRTFVYESWSKNHGEKNLVRYLEPRRVKGQATLMLNHADDIWMFFPRTQRVRKLATHAKKQKMEGSDFSYEDMGSGDAFVQDYTPQRLPDEKKREKMCFKLELLRKPECDTSYSRLIMWVSQDNFVPVVIEYYDDRNRERLQKFLVQSDIQVIQGIPTAKKMVMFNQNDNTKTEMELLEIKYNLSLDDSMFTERELKK